MAESIDTAFCWSITRIAEGFGFDRGTVRRKLRAAGIEPATKDRRYRLAEAVPALYHHGGGEQDPAKMTPQERKSWFESENYRLDLDRTMAHLVTAEAFANEKQHLANAIQSGLEALPDQLAPVLDEPATSHVRMRMTALCEQVQTFAAGFGDE